MRLWFNGPVTALLEGAMDLHIHAAPDLIPRILSDLDLARQAQEAGMGAIVIKSHFEPTAGRARLAADETGFPVYGGLALNQTVGGLNPYAVDYALRLGAKLVWLPTIHAAHFLARRDHVQMLAMVLNDGAPGISVFDQERQVRGEMIAILDLIAAHDAVLATGHVSVAEARAVVREAAGRGVKRILVTHPLASFVGYTVDDMKEMLDLGATYLEMVYNDTTPVVKHPLPVQALVDGIRAVGPAHCIMATDSGQWRNPVPVQQMCIYIEEMLNLGLSEAEIRTMTAENPARLLGIPPIAS